VIFPEEMRRVVPCLEAEGLTGRLIEAADPDVDDDQIEIFRDNAAASVVIRIGRGGYHVSELRGEGAARVRACRGSFLSLRKAIDRAIDVVKSGYLCSP